MGDPPPPPAGRLGGDAGPAPPAPSPSVVRSQPGARVCPRRAGRGSRGGRSSRLVEGEGALEVTSSGVLRQTVLACLILSVAVAVIASASGHLDLGLGMAAGLMLGSVNGYFIQGLLNRGAPFMAASLLRILFFSSLVLIAALTMRGSAWTVALGIGLAQLVMVAAGVRSGLRR